MKSTKSTQDALLQRLAGGNRHIGRQTADAFALWHRGLIDFDPWRNTAELTPEGRAYMEKRTQEQWR